MRVPIFFACAVVLGCGRSPAPPPTVSPPPSASTAAPDEGPAVALNLNGAQAFEVLAAMESFAGEPVLVDAAALSSLRCATVSVAAPERMPKRAAAEKIAAALRTEHYRVEHTAGQWVVSVDASAPPPACAPPAPAPVATAEAPDDASSEIAGDVRKVSETEYVITRHAFEVLLEKMPTLLKHVRIVPEVTAGKTVGVRLFGVREGSMPAHLGLQNGDRLERVEGHELSSPDHALEAYAAVRTANRMTLEIQRHGAPMKILYRVE